MKPPKAPLTHEAIADAAIRCFERYGPQRTSMADIADEVGASRQSVYRFFEDRSTLIQYILNNRIAQMAERLTKQFSRYQTIEEALVEGSLLSIRQGRKDPLFMAMVTESTDHRLEVFLLRGTDQIRTSMLMYWGPILDQARDEGRIRSNLTNERLLDWIMSFHTILMLRDDQSEAWQRSFLQDFFLPSIVKPVEASTQPKKQRASAPRTPRK